ncbi:hypothetical protein NP233_g11187 [Leucocoprinus birnbaumii]|uniref:Uncharacterized protein n=1 Tax=Leucocoprinus birnbaumii TaxID=56174 RepID=A0AAD5YR72_9AGAR|nr:hypothetical protein NP233_g11187 [Leucocoprinus birnbaumii]
MALFRGLLDRFYRMDHYHIVLGGYHGGGKTTLLYLLKEGKLLPTIPTVTPNIETVSLPTISSDGAVKTDGNLELVTWDMGVPGSQAGRGGYSILLQAYAERGDALVWIVDSTDRMWMKDSVELLRETLELIDRDESDAQKSKCRPLLLCVSNSVSFFRAHHRSTEYVASRLANKQDRHDAMSLEDIRRAFEPALENRPLCGILPTSFVKGLTAESGIAQAFSQLRAVIELSRRRVDKVGHKMVSTSRPPAPFVDLEELNRWFSRLKTDISPDELLMRFSDGSLLPWDHYMKIRVIFHVLRKRGRQAFNAVKAKHGPELRPGEFIRFLSEYPHVVNDNLWKEYYSEGAMRSEAAHRGLVIPDKKTFPSFVGSAVPKWLLTLIADHRWILIGRYAIDQDNDLLASRRAEKRWMVGGRDKVLHYHTITSSALTLYSSLPSSVLAAIDGHTSASSNPSELLAQTQPLIPRFRRNL